ncbi:YkgJ family cysteine cluster protein [Aeromonas media]|uniref:YkgJ family cysteine cluster protein n=1 Tax=Aeromonas media TaxID=651 RepID=UPI003D15986A
MAPFHCNKCGQCCRNVGMSELTTFLDRIDSVCHHFNEMKNICSIYEKRPLVCRVENFYTSYLSVR